MPTITPGSQTATFTISAPGTYTLDAGATRTQTAGTAIQATVTSGTTTIDIEGALAVTASAARGIRAALVNGKVIVGANGSIQTLDADAVQEQAFTGTNAPVSTVDLTNLGQIRSGTSVTTITSSGANPPGAAYALNYNAAVGAANAPAGDVTSGGVITNGAANNTTALIQSDSGDAIRLGAHQTLTNYGVIRGAGPVNDSSSNNVFSNTSTATRYDISRGVRINASTATNDTVNNFGLIEGAQHGVDVGNLSATNIVVKNAAGAWIVGLNGSGVGADTTGAAAGTVSVTNAGLIRGAYAPTYDRAGLRTVDGDGDGVDIDGGATIVNLAGGIIEGAGAGGYDSNGRLNNSEGISIGGGIVTNAGTIRGAAFGIVVNNDSNADGSRSGVAATQVTNAATGSILGQAGYAIRFENKTGTAADNDTIVNAGIITGNSGIPSGTVLRQNGVVDPGTVGTLDGVVYTTADAGSARFIRGDGAAIQTGEGADSLTNYATITGNSGRAVSLEGGNDTLILYTGSTVTGRIDGGAGTDTLILRLDDRAGTDARLGGNSGATAGTLTSVVNFETLAVQGGIWTVQDAQTYTAGIAIAAGAGLTVGANGSIAGPVSDAGVLTFAHAGDLAVSDAITGSGRVVQAGTDAVTLSAASTYSGGTTLVSGTLDLAGATTGGFGAIVSAAAGTGAITFSDGAQTLRIARAALGADGSFANTVSAFGTDGDVIDLRGIGSASARFDYASNVLSLIGTQGSTVATLHLVGSYAGSIFTAASDGVDGTQVGRAAVSLAVTAALASDTGTSASDGVTSLATITGTANAGAVLSLTDEAGRGLGSATAGTDGRYTIAPGGLADGRHTLTVTESYAGTTAVATLGLTLDTTAPALGADAASGTGVTATLTGSVLANDTDASALHLAGVQFGMRTPVTVPASGTVQVTGDHGVLSIGADGSYRYQPTSVGHDVFTEIVADAAGNTSRTTLALDVARAAIPAAASFGFALTEARFNFGNGHDLMTAPNGTVTDLTGVGTITFADGTVQERDGQPLVDDLYYYAGNLDVWRAHLDPDQHYAQYGWHEGRDPDALFSTKGYLAANPDVAAAGIDPLQHYDQYGWHEGRSPGVNFSAEAYLAANQDVARAGLDPLVHYLAYGQAEGRVVYPGLSIAQGNGHHLYGDFDASFYLAQNADVARAATASEIRTDSFAFSHYLTYGVGEGRDPSAYFSTKGYLAANPDVAAAAIDPLQHYHQYGWHEGRDPGPAFHTDAYLTANPDVAAAQIDPLQHYLQYGIGEARPLA